MTAPFRRRAALLVLASLPLLAACGGDSAGEADADAEPARAESASAENPHACEILTPAFIEAELGVAGVEEDSDPETRSTYTSCTLVWPSDVTEEREIAGRTVRMPTENRVTLSLSVFEPGGATAAYDAGIGTLQARYESTPVEGLGDAAMWFPDMDQVTVRSGDDVFHLAATLPDGEGTPLEKATRVARAVLEELQ